MPAVGSRAVSASACSYAPASRRARSSQATPDGLFRKTWATARVASAAAWFSAPASRRLLSSPATADG